MGIGRFCFILLPWLLTACTTALAIVSFFGSYKTLKGLDLVYFMKLDLSNANFGSVSLQNVASNLNISQIYQIGANGYCYGSKNNDGTTKLSGCKTPTTPFWFNIVDILSGASGVAGNIKLPDEITKYQTVLKAASYTIWACLLVAICLSFLVLLIGVLAIWFRGGSCCAVLLILLDLLVCIVAAGAATGLYKIYSQKFNQYGTELGVSASLGRDGIVLVWVLALAALISTVLWILSICCGSTGSRRSKKATEEKEPFIGYAPYHE